MNDALTAIGAGALLAWVGLPLLDWSVARPHAEAPESRQRHALLALLLSVSLLAVPAIAALIPRAAHGTVARVAPWAVVAFSTARPVAAHGLSWLELVGLVWMAAVAVCALGAAVRAVRLFRLRRRARLAPTDVVMQAVELSRDSGALPPWVLVSSEARVPFVAGVLRPYVIIPEGLLEALEPSALALVIGHELCHLRRGDPWKALVVGFARALLFPHPSARRLIRAWAQAREEAVDARVAAPDPHAYAHLLVDVAAHTAFGRREAFLVSIRGSSLERRITMLGSPRPNAGRSWIFTLVLAVVLAGLGALIPIARAQTPGTHTQAAKSGHGVVRVKASKAIVLSVGHAVSISLHGARRIAVTDPSVAEVRPTGGGKVEINARSPGMTKLLVWDRSGRRTTYLIDVRP